MGGLSWWHWVIIAAAFILIFGARKLPDAARGVGRSLRILKSEVAAMHEDGDKPDSGDGASTTATATRQAPSEISPAATPVAQPSAAAADPQPAQQSATAAQPPAAATPAAPPAEHQTTAAPVINGVPVAGDNTK